MKIEDLEAFVAVVRCQSISAAAEALQLAQPTVTRRVQNLEEALGTELLDRAVKPPKPNAAGRQVHEQCRSVLREIEALRALVGAETRAAGRLRLGLTQGLGDLVLPKALQRLRQRWPELQAEVATGWSAQMIDRLEHGELDGAVVLLPGAQGRPRPLEGHSLGSLRLVVVGARGCVAKARPRLADIAGLGWVLNPDGCGFRAGLQRALATLGLALDLRAETFGRELQLELVAAGVGLGLLPEPLLAASAFRSQLQVIPVADFQPGVELWLLQARQLGKLQAPLAEFAARTAQALKLGARKALPTP